MRITNRLNEGAGFTEPLNALAKLGGTACLQVKVVLASPVGGGTIKGQAFVGTCLLAGRIRRNNIVLRGQAGFVPLAVVFEQSRFRPVPILRLGGFLHRLEAGEQSACYLLKRFQSRLIATSKLRQCCQFLVFAPTSPA